MRLARCLASGLALAWLQCAAALAHPHAWIDIEAKLLLDERGAARAIELDWLFDEFYTAFVSSELYDEMTADKPDSEKPSATDFIKSVAETNLANLDEFDYFADLRVNGQRQDLGTAPRYETGVRGNRLWLRFEVPLAEPLEIAGASVTLAIYDPTYYVEILYAEGSSLHVEGPGAERCVVSLHEPDPQPEQIALAFSLDQTESAGDGLGIHFAQTARVACK